MVIIIATIIASIMFTTTTIKEKLYGTHTAYSDPNEEHFAKQKPKWWQSAVIYEIFPASFKGKCSAQLLTIVHHDLLTISTPVDECVKI